MILTVGGTKGGSGKTTIATNIAVFMARNGRRVILVDADEQQSASVFHEIRSETLNDKPLFSSVKLTGSKVHLNLRDLASHYEDVIVDTGGRDTTAQRSALLASDAFLIPLAPSAYDVWTSGMVDQVVSVAKTFNPSLKTFVVLNRVLPTTSPAKLQEVIDAVGLTEHLQVLTEKLIARVAYQHAAAQGLSIFEYASDVKAISEFENMMISFLNELPDSNANEEPQNVVQHG